MAVLTAFISLAALCAGRPASAQLPLLGGPTAITAGVFVPTDSRPTHAGGGQQLSLEARYALPGVPFTGLKTVVSVGLEDGSQGGGHSTIIPFTIGEYAGSGGVNPLKFKDAYIGAGLGPYLENESGISTTTRIGGFVAVGYNTPIALFVEGKYQFVQDGSGFTASVGLRF